MSLVSWSSPLPRALATLACARGALFFAPAMHHRMWSHPATRSNVQTLTDRGAVVLGPVTGALAKL